MRYASSAGAQEASLDDRFELIRELGSRRTPTFLARMRDSEGQRLVVVEQCSRAALGEAPIEPLVAAPRAIAEVRHTNLVRVREFRVEGDLISTVTDFVDGELWSELLGQGAKLPAPVSLRVLSDICTALVALRATRGPGGQSMPMAHGEVVGSNILVGLDGNARLLRACRLRPEPSGSGSCLEAAALPSGYESLAPEVLEGRPADGRSDVYSVGVLLWGALSGEALFGGAEPSAILGRLRQRDIPPARVSPEEAWAAPLADIIARALSLEPEKRPPSAVMMGTEIRKVAGSRLATVATVAAVVKGAAGAKIKARRAVLDSGFPPPLAGAAPSPSPADATKAAPILPSAADGPARADASLPAHPSPPRPPPPVPNRKPAPPPAAARPLAPPLHVPPAAPRDPPAPKPAVPVRAPPPVPPAASKAPPIPTRAQPPEPAAAAPPPPTDDPPEEDSPSPAAPPAVASSTLAESPPVPVASFALPESLPIPVSIFDAPPPPLAELAPTPAPQPPPAVSATDTPPPSPRPPAATPKPAHAPATEPPATLDRERETDPSVVAQTRAQIARRRKALVAVSVVCTAAAVIAAWGFVKRTATSDSGASATLTKPPEPPPPPSAAPPAVQAPSATATAEPVAVPPPPADTGVAAAPTTVPPPEPTTSAPPAKTAAAVKPAVARPPAPASTAASTAASPAKTTPTRKPPPPAKSKYGFDPTKI